MSGICINHRQKCLKNRQKMCFYQQKNPFRNTFKNTFPTDGKINLAVAGASQNGRKKIVSPSQKIS